MSEEAAPVAPVVEAPATPGADLPPMTPELRAAFTAPQPVSEPAPTPAAPAEQPIAPTPAAPVEKQPETLDYAPLLKELGVDSVDALKAAQQVAKEADTYKANQRDAHDEAVRNMLADPTKARAYFELQSLKPDVLATGTPDQQRQLLYEKYKLDHPQYSAERAEVEFEDEFETKYALADGDNADDPAVRRAKLRFQDDLAAATPAVKAAQEAAKIALVPPPANPSGLTPEQQQAINEAWTKGTTELLAKPTIEQVFQTENGPVTVAYSTKDAALGAFLDNPLQAVENYFQQIAYPNGKGQPADQAALATAFYRLTQPEAIAAAAAKVGKASVGAHIPMERAVNATPLTPQAPSGGGEDQAGALAAIRAVAQGRR